MSKTEQDLDVSSDAALTDDVELIETDPDVEPIGNGKVATDDDEAPVDGTPGDGMSADGTPADGTPVGVISVEDLADEATPNDDASDELVDELDDDDETPVEVVPVDDDDVLTTSLDDDTADLDDDDSRDDAAADLDDDDDLDDDELDDDNDNDLDAELDDAELDDDDDDAESESEVDAELDDGSDPFEIPPILIATAYDADDASGETAVDPDARDDTGGTPLAPPAPSTDILEELRRADIDGPIVEMAPQDDTTSARRRPKKPIDYDPAPVPIPLQVPRILGRKPRVRKVTRVVRHVDPWSVFKIAIIANMVLYLIVLTAGVLLWNVAYATGTVDNVERFFESFGWQSFEFNGGEIYHSGWIAGLFVAIGLTGLAVLVATLFNLITDLVGGVRFTVLEEEVVESRTSPMRRFVVRRTEPEIPAVMQDASGSIIREAVVDDTGDLPR